MTLQPYMYIPNIKITIQCDYAVEREPARVVTAPKPFMANKPWHSAPKVIAPPPKGIYPPT